MKKRMQNIILIIIFFIGLSLLLYPTLSNLYNQYHQSRTIATYVEKVDELNKEEYEKILAEANEYNRILASKEAIENELKNYDKVLNVTGDGVMGYIEIPKINVKLPIYHGTSESALQIAIGHLSGSSLPVGGNNTHTVLLGHRGLPSAKLFTNLDKMELGDIFFIHYLNKKIAFKVDNIKVVLPEEVNDLKIEKNKKYVTLVTCTPYSINTHRLLVRGHQVTLKDEEVETHRSYLLPIIIIASVILITIGLIIKHRKKKR